MASVINSQLYCSSVESSSVTFTFDFSRLASILADLASFRTCSDCLLFLSEVLSNFGFSKTFLLSDLSDIVLHGNQYTRTLRRKKRVLLKRILSAEQTCKVKRRGFFFEKVGWRRGLTLLSNL
jgi:hypothetical protein